MDTPICDFVRRYADSQALRLHMPGHKGASVLGMEALDITEIPGADSLYEATGIIRRSEANASGLFGCPTFYSTEGSSQCIRAMLYLALLSRREGGRPLIAAFRNVHRTFLSAAALLDLDVAWLYSRQGSYLSCPIAPGELAEMLDDMPRQPLAVYLTSPDYLGHMADIAGIARECHRRGILLLVDNAHGAYLRFLPQSRHPMDLGADICCDSAHKTLPVLTGGAYLHVAVPELAAQAKNALALFGSTSPSYLILQSLDMGNRYLEDYPSRLAGFLEDVAALKEALRTHGYRLCGQEPLKVTLEARSYGYTGRDLEECLRREEIICEFADDDHLVLMLTPEIGAAGLARLEKALLAIPQREARLTTPPAFHPAQQVMSIREAMLSPMETLPLEQAEGRILAAATVGCPPAVPIAVCGERIDGAVQACMRYYGVKSCTVVRA